MFLTLIQNVALVVLLATALRYLARILIAHPRLSVIASGVVYGAVAVVGMLTPFSFSPGVFYDGRSIVMSLAGLFGGAPVALVAGAITVGYRIFLGGPGAFAGVMTVVTSGVLGVGMHRLSRGRLASLRTVELVAFGLVVHIAMLGVQYLLLPADMGARVVREVGPLLLTLFPFATAFAARMMIEQLEREQVRAALVDESSRLRLAMAAAEEGTWDLDIASDTMSLSAEAARLMGLGDGPASMPSAEWRAGIHPEDRTAFDAHLAALASEHTDESGHHFRWHHPDGRHRWYQLLGVVSDRNAAGEPTRILGIIADVSRTLRAAEAMERRVIEAELLAVASARLLRAPDRDSVFAVVRDFFAAEFPEAVVIINEVDPSDGALVTRDVVGVDANLVHKAEQLIGWAIHDQRYPVTKAYRRILEAGRMERIEGGLSELAREQVPQAVARALERMLGTVELWTIGVADSGLAHAGVHVLTRELDAEMPCGVVESFANLCFVTLERLRTQERLAESEAQFRTLIEQTDQGVSVGHPDGRLLVYNRAMEDISGYTKEEVERESWFELVFPTPERRAEAIRLAADALDGGLPYLETEIVRKDGGTRWVSVATTPVVLGGDTYNMSIFTDVTLRRDAERALHESEHRFRALVDTAPEAIFVQTEHRFAYLNEAAVGLYGATTADELIGQPVLDRIRVDMRELARARIEALNEDHRSQPPQEMVHLRMDGSEIDVETSGAPIMYGRKPGAVVFVRDITEAKRSAAELEQHREHLEELVSARTRDLEAANVELKRTTDAKVELFTRLSHELRTPLNSIIGFSAILRQGVAGPLTEEQGVEVGMINSAGRHLLAIINDLLDLTRAQVGRAPVDRQDFSAGELLEEVADFLRPLAGDAGLDLRVATPESEVRIESDRMKVKRILLNLGGNAVKFTGEGHIELCLTAEVGVVRFAVSDTGRGVRLSQIPLIFEPFSQVDVDSGLEHEGTGLGLTISRELARLLGGEIHVTSEPGKGSTFSLTLPRSAN
ncbi:MAG: PAS domain S-box protein [Coriobacteriia bacterium]|nr:PAS domain S-box protein [Coriobacteriia bacterium]